jgi:hypothetical protein
MIWQENDLFTGRGMEWGRISVAAFVLILFCGCRASEEEIVGYVRFPPPKSLKVINAYDSGEISKECFLHFTVASNDLSKIIVGDNYGKIYQPLARADFRGAPAWWDPEKLGLDRIQVALEHAKSTGESVWKKYIIHNKEGTEVFFMILYYY